MRILLWRMPIPAYMRGTIGFGLAAYAFGITAAACVIQVLFGSDMLSYP